MAEGHEGRFILIKGEEVIGIWKTQEEAESVARKKYLLQPCLIHQVRSREPLLRHFHETLAMAKLVFPFLPDGLAVDVVIGLDGATLAAQIASGQAMTPPMLTHGEIDTGSNITAVSTAILQRLGLSALYQSTTQTPAGPVAVDVFKVSVGIRNLATPTIPELVEPNLLVMELPTAFPDVEVLIGLNFPLGCKFQLDGPGRWFSLEP